MLVPVHFPEYQGLYSIWRKSWNTLLFAVSTSYFVGYQGVQGHWNSWNRFSQLPYIRVTRTHIRALNIKYFPRGEYKKGVPTVPLALEPLTIKDYDGTFLKMLPVPSVPISLRTLNPKACSWNTFLIQLLYPLPISPNYVNASPCNTKIITSPNLICMIIILILSFTPTPLTIAYAPFKGISIRRRGISHLYP